MDNVQKIDAFFLMSSLRADSLKALLRNCLDLKSAIKKPLVVVCLTSRYILAAREPIGCSTVLPGGSLTRRKHLMYRWEMALLVVTV